MMCAKKESLAYLEVFHTYIGRGSYHFNHYTQAVACRALCIIPRVGMIGYHYTHQLDIIIIII
jgi:hypothetical protein